MATTTETNNNNDNIDIDNIIIVGGGIAGSGMASLLAAAGLAVTVLERTSVFPDRVRGEMYTPWGVKIAQEIGLAQPLLDAGAMFTTDWVFYDAAFPAEMAESMAVDASAIVEGVPGILNITHPSACQALFDNACSKHATMVRGVVEIDLDLSGDRPKVRWTLDDGTSAEATASVVIGADGRASQVRRSAGIELHSAPIRQYMSGLLIEGDQLLSSHIDSYGTGTDVNWYSFPQGPNRSRVYLAHFDVHRYAGSSGTERFLADLAQAASPDVASLATGRAVTPVATHPSVDTWTDEPFAPGVVLIGDSAGYNDPIIGQGLSLAMADVRDVSRVILAGGRSPEDFVAYGIARCDRFAKQRLASQTMADMMCSFGEDASNRRLRALPMLGTDETVGLLAATLFAGPEILPAGTGLLEAASAMFLSA
jgi:menaquinone-9 beta-reductase